MPTERGSRPRALPALALRCVALAAVLALALAGCAPVREHASGGTRLAPPVEAPDALTADSGSARRDDADGATSTTRPAVPAPTVAFDPAPGAQGIRPDNPVRVTVENGRLTSMTVTSPSGPVPGTFAGGLFTPAQPLEFGQTYTVSATAESRAGESTAVRSLFTTIVPAAEISAEVYPFEGDVVGVGMPVIVTFSSPVPAEARPALTARFAVSSVPAVEGSWRWLNDSTMHWRPRTYWPAGTAVSVTGGVAGHGVGDEWFTTSVAQSFAIGPDHRITIDATTHQMVAYENGQPIRTMPISTGSDAYPTASGVDLIMEKYDEFEMDSSSVGITGSEAYLVTVAHAQRLTYSGTFLHAAPWNSQLGSANTSHGCINASDEDAAWMMAFTLIGDPVEISGTPEQVSWGNGWGDWNIPYDQWAGTSTE